MIARRSSSSVTVDSDVAVVMSAPSVAGVGLARVQRSDRSGDCASPDPSDSPPPQRADVASTGAGTGVTLVRKGRATSTSIEPHIRLLGGFSVAVGDNVVSDRAW